jgi:hypothetical protein
MSLAYRKKIGIFWSFRWNSSFSFHGVGVGNGVSKNHFFGVGVGSGVSEFLFFGVGVGVGIKNLYDAVHY